MKNLATILRRNPGAIIQYYDKGSWVIYANQADYKKAEQGDGVATIAAGYDGYSDDSYAPNLVVALASLLGIKVDSV